MQHIPGKIMNASLLPPNYNLAYIFYSLYFLRTKYVFLIMK